ncbi:hypothetical protein RV134_320167 [Roseovarius sp. EC-HK134]|nr:hypothetical protein RV420_380096 [Roseovarius sp. EC-SD190]VVT23665.1 hypothetical protein RV134_320167 [Roseovarius sp. EC-HK134]
MRAECRAELRPEAFVVLLDEGVRAAAFGQGCAARLTLGKIPSRNRDAIGV